MLPAAPPLAACRRSAIPFALTPLLFLLLLSLLLDQPSFNRRRMRSSPLPPRFLLCRRRLCRTLPLSGLLFLPPPLRRRLPLLLLLRLPLLLELRKPLLLGSSLLLLFLLPPPCSRLLLSGLFL